MAERSASRTARAHTKLKHSGELTLGRGLWRSILLFRTTFYRSTVPWAWCYPPNMEWLKKKSGVEFKSNTLYTQIRRAFLACLFFPPALHHQLTYSPFGEANMLGTFGTMNWKISELFTLNFEQQPQDTSWRYFKVQLSKLSFFIQSYIRDWNIYPPWN